MWRSMVDIQSPTAEIRRGKKEEEERNRMKIYMVSLFHRATINDATINRYNSKSDYECAQKTQV